MQPTNHSHARLVSTTYHASIPCKHVEGLLVTRADLCCHMLPHLNDYTQPQYACHPTKTICRALTLLLLKVNLPQKKWPFAFQAMLTDGPGVDHTVHYCWQYRSAFKYGRLLYTVSTFGISQTTLCTAILSKQLLYVLRLSTTGDDNNIFNGFGEGSPKLNFLIISRPYCKAVR